MKRTYNTAIAFALFLLVLELTYINSKSLLFLVSESGLVDKAFAVVGAMAFSVVTVLVMRTSSSKWMRIVFPIFDTLLVFCGFNLKYADNLLGNPVAFYLTIFIALFTGLIMYSLGSIGSKLAVEKQQHAAEKLQPATIEEHEGNLQHSAKNMQEYSASLQPSAKSLQLNVSGAAKNASIMQKRSYKCSICGREFATDTSRRSHEGHCKKNVNVKKIAL